MPDFLRDPNWIDAIIGFVALVVGSAITIFIFRRERRSKKLTYEIVTSEPLLTFSEEHAGDVKILFKDNEVKDVHILVFKLRNSGNVSIEESDMSWPPAFSFGKETTILSYEIIGKNPTDLPAKLRKSGGDRGIVLERLLLNSDDYICMKYLLSNYKGEFQPSCRIVGIKEITENSRRKIPRLVLSLAVFNILILFLILIVRGFSLGAPPDILIQLSTIVIIALIAISIGTIVGVSLTRPLSSF